MLISVGGQNGNWGWIYANSTSITAFVNSLVKIVNDYKLDGVDLDIESYLATPRTVANSIIQLKTALGKKLLVVSPECVTVYQGVADYSADTAGQAFNYFVNVIRLADKYIDYYQPQAYNNWYDFPGGTLDYLKDVYLNWRNLQGLCPDCRPIPSFKGVPAAKLFVGDVVAHFFEFLFYFWGEVGRFNLKHIWSPLVVDPCGGHGFIQRHFKFNGI